MYFNTSVCHVLFQQLLLPVGDWYERCGCVGAWAKHGVCQQRKALNLKNIVANG